VSLLHRRLHVIYWAKLEEKYAQKMIFGKGALYRIAGRTTLINASLVNYTIYHMSMYLMSKNVIKKMDKGRRKFSGRGGGSLKKKYHLVR
jgi:hypothetical protein